MAAALMPSVEARIADLRQQLANAEMQLHRLKQVELIGNGEVPQLRSTEPEGKTTQDDIDAVLLASAEVPMTVAEIKQQIANRFGRDRAASTLYNYLGKGKTAGWYVNEEGAWMLTQAGKARIVFA